MNQMQSKFYPNPMRHPAKWPGDAMDKFVKSDYREALLGRAMKKAVSEEDQAEREKTLPVMRDESQVKKADPATLMEVLRDYANFDNICPHKERGDRIGLSGHRVAYYARMLQHRGYLTRNTAPSGSLSSSRITAQGRALLEENSDRQSMVEIAQAVLARHEVTMREARAPGRATSRVARAKQEVMWECSKAGYSLNQIGRYFSRSFETVRDGIRQHKKRVNE